MREKEKKEKKTIRGKIMTKSDTSGGCIFLQSVRYLLREKISFWKGGGGEYDIWGWMKSTINFILLK